MIPLLINVEGTAKGARKAELSINAGYILIHGRGLMRHWAKRPLPSPPSHVNTSHVNVSGPGGLL